MVLPSKIGVPSSKLMSHMVLLAHPGTQYSHQLAQQLVRHDSLYEFWTGFGLSPNGLLGQVIANYTPRELRRKIANRVIQGVPISSLRTTPIIELRALERLRRGQPPQQVFYERNEAFQKTIPTNSLEKSSAIIGFDTSSWLLGERAQQIGKPYFLDQSTSHPLANQSIMEGVARRFPDWRQNIEMRLPALLASEMQEYDLATKIVAASSFSRETLVSQGVPSDKIVLNPYGVDLNLFHPPLTSRRRQSLRFLFLGSLSARKGVPLLLEAWKTLNLKDSELWLTGPVSKQDRALIPPMKGLKVLGKLPHKELPDLLRTCDVLVFPSYSEGFGLVLLEALASGMPIITTEATAGPDLIRDGVEGRLVTSGDADALSAAMHDLAKDYDKLEGMALAARRCAERFSWDAYGDRWQRLLADCA